MGLMKINQILKKYKDLHKRHIASWDEAQKRIRAANKIIQDKMNDSEHIYENDAVYRAESYNYMRDGNKLLEEMMKELEGHEIFPKKFKPLDQKGPN